MTARSRTTLATNLAANLANNTSGAITPTVMRTHLTDMTDSASNVDDSIFVGVGEMSEVSTGLQPTRMQTKTVAGSTAGNITVTGIDSNDILLSVLRLNRDGTASNIDISDLTSEFTLTADDTINNTSGTNTTGDTLVVFWTGGHRSGGIALDGSTTESFAVVKPVPQSWLAVDVYLYALSLEDDGGVAIISANAAGQQTTETSFTVAAQYTVTRVQIMDAVPITVGTISPINGTDKALCFIRIDRTGASGSDTLTGDLVCMFVELAKAA